MRVYVIYIDKGPAVAVSARPFEDIVRQYGAPEFGTKEIKFTAQGAYFVREDRTPVAQAMEVEE